MSDRKFEIHGDPARNLLSIVWSGHWDLATVDAYKKDLLRVVAQMHAKGVKAGQIVALVDARTLGPQSRDVAEAYKKSFSDPTLKPRRLATLVSSALFKMQVQRLAVADQQIFDDEQKAMEWLLS